MINEIKKAFGGWDSSVAARPARGDGGRSAVLPEEARRHRYRGELALGPCRLTGDEASPRTEGDRPPGQSTSFPP